MREVPRCLRSQTGECTPGQGPVGTRPDPCCWASGSRAAHHPHSAPHLLPPGPPSSWVSLSCRVALPSCQPHPPSPSASSSCGPCLLTVTCPAGIPSLNPNLPPQSAETPPMNSFHPIPARAPLSYSNTQSLSLSLPCHVIMAPVPKGPCLACPAPHRAPPFAGMLVAEHPPSAAPSGPSAPSATAPNAPTTPAAGEPPWQGVQTALRSIWEGGRVGGPVTSFTPTCSPAPSWTQHPLIQKNRRVVLASFLLLLLGLGECPGARRPASSEALNPVAHGASRHPPPVP